ncbi:MAG: hypothetical protein R3E01_34335 [Pirellulaceae bacterium]|nr:hypothetical protein [Planctomycetales bacterium]
MLPGFRWCDVRALILFVSIVSAFWGGYDSCYGQPQVVCLTTTRMPCTVDRTVEDRYVPNTFDREIVRQAFLLAARDVFGVSTRDESLREPMPEQTTNTAMLFAMDVANLQTKQIEYELRFGDKLLTKGIIPYQFSSTHSTLITSADRAEQLARTDFVDALKTVGLRAAGRDESTPPKLPAEIEPRLRQMDVVSQFLAIRQAHQAIAEHGEHGPAVAALTMGYANLSQLTCFYHMSLDVAFQARAILYGTRLIQMYPESPLGYWHRAYAFTMLGLTKESIYDLETADTIAASHPPRTTPPWLPLIRSANKFDFKELQEPALEADQWQQLAIFLWFRSVEFSGSEYLAIEIGEKGLRVAPGCLRINSGMTRVAGVRHGHKTTTLPLIVLPNYLNDALTNIAEAADALPLPTLDEEDPSQSPIQITRLAMSLVEQSGVDRHLAEPSNAVLGRLIEEQNVLNLSSRAMFVRDWLGSDATDFLDAVKDAYQQHPLAPLISACALRNGGGGYDAFLSEYDPPDTNFVSTNPLFARVPREVNFKHTTNGQFQLVRWMTYTSSEPDYLSRMVLEGPESQLKKARWLYDMQPAHPYRFALLIRRDWEDSKKHLDDWKEFLEHPVVAIELAQQYETDGKTEEAEGNYRRCIETAPDFLAFQRLTRLYWRYGDDEGAFATAKLFLEQADYGLNHATLCKDLAYSLMSEQRYKEALPWAERSAASGAEWAEQTLAICYEGLQQFDDAYRVWVAIDERYGTNREYSFAARTRHIDLATAWSRRWEQLQAKYPDETNPERRLPQAFQWLLEDKFQEAAGTYAAIHADYHDPYWGFLTALSAAAAKDTATRDAALANIVNRDFSWYPGESEEGTSLSKELAKLLQQGFSKGEFDKQAFVRLVGENSTVNQHWVMMYSFAGRFLELQGDEQGAIPYLENAAASGAVDYEPVILATDRLRKMGRQPLTLHRRFFNFGRVVQPQ